MVTPIRKILPPHPSSVPVAPRSKRPAPATAPEKIDDSFFRRNFSAIAAAAAAVEAEAEEEEEDRSGGGDVWGDSPAAAAYRDLAEAIGRFGEIYERVEEAKQRQVIELEKKRMEFAKDLEIQRMKLFMESQVRLEKIKRAKPISDSEAGEFSFLSSVHICLHCNFCVPFFLLTMYGITMKFSLPIHYVEDNGSVSNLSEIGFVDFYCMCIHMCMHMLI